MSNKTFSNSITITRVADGKSASTRFIETEYEEILMFQNEDGLVFSPEEYTFRVVDFGSESENQYIENFDWECGYLNDGQEYVKLGSSAEGNYNHCFHSLENNNSVKYLSLTELYSSLEDNYLANAIENGSAVFKLVHYEDSKIMAIKYFFLRYGVSKEMAQLSIGAESITAAIRDSFLQFSSAGLTVGNGAFKIVQDFYEPIDLDSGSYVPGKYYILDNNNAYVLDQSGYNPNEKYFNKILKPVLYFNEKTGNLTLTGDVYAANGEFTGIIHASDGNFTGTIQATGGSIGGFYLENGVLRSDAKTSEGKNSIVLDGKTGQVEAENINLGGGARVTDKIVFSTSESDPPTFVLYNPSLYKINETKGGKVLEAAQITMTNKGYLNLGTLELYGGTGQMDGYIRSGFVDANGQSQTGFWEIRENGSAMFDNITVNNAHIQNSILEISTTQSVGSTMIFKDAWTIEGIETDGNGDLVYCLDSLASNLFQYGYILINNNVYKIRTQPIDENGKTKIGIYGNPALKNGDIVMSLGISGELNFIEATETEKLKGRFYYTKDDNDRYTPFEGVAFEEGEKYYYLGPTEGKDCIISIQGSSEPSSGGVNTLSVPQAISFSSFCDYGSNDKPLLAYTKHLILGKLEDSEIDDLKGISGYGLYADNVYLNGSLTTHSSQGGYAGINTLNGSSFSKGGDSVSDTSQIIFWGGATDKNNITNAPFQVTANGTLYAQKAIIKDSTVIGGILEAATIKTANIYGSGASNSALTFHDVQKGITFGKTITIYDDDSGDDEFHEIFSIGENGFKRGSQDFIKIPEEGPVEFYGRLNSGAATYNENGVFFADIGEIFWRKDYLNQEKNNYLPQICFNLQGKEAAVLDSSLSKFNTKVGFAGGVLYGKKEDGTYALEQRQVLERNEIVGYDIYVY